MQNLPNITSVEGVVVGSAVLVLWWRRRGGWSDARRRRKVLALAAAREAAWRGGGLAREALVGTAPPGMAGRRAEPGGSAELWDEPTVTVGADALSAAPPQPADAIVFEAPAEPPATIEALPSTPVEAPPPAAEAPLPVQEVPAQEVAVSAPPPAAEAPRFPFCLQELRRVRLPNWPPAEVRRTRCAARRGAPANDWRRNTRGTSVRRRWSHGGRSSRTVWVRRKRLRERRSCTSSCSRCCGRPASSRQLPKRCSRSIWAPARSAAG